ncbi:MAG: hypothetical protein WBY94_17860 [Polyangiaceae bacterium]
MLVTVAWGAAEGEGTLGKGAVVVAWEPPQPASHAAAKVGPNEERKRCVRMKSPFSYRL